MHQGDGGRAFADGVLGEFARADVVVSPGKNLDLGFIPWTPVRRGRQIWEIGIPNRNGSEFAGAETYWEPEISLEEGMARTYVWIEAQVRASTHAELGDSAAVRSLDREAAGVS